MGNTSERSLNAKLAQLEKELAEKNRELEIEAALERVRARTMAMQKSDELSETVYVLFQQFKELGENPDQATIGIVNEDEKLIEYWVTMYGKPINKVFKFSIDEPNVTNKIYNAWKENKKSLMIDLSGDALTEFMTYRAGKGGAAINLDEKRRIINVAFFSKGLLNVQSNEERSEESIKLLERFASVFEQTYTRFLDLQKAEAQTREAQIEAALERVRGSAMAMHNSNDISNTTSIVFTELQKLGIQSIRCGIGLLSKDSSMASVYAATTSLDGKFHTLRRIIDMTEHSSLAQQYETWLKQENYQTVLSGEELKSYYNLPFFHSSATYVPPEHYDQEEYGYYISFSEGLFYAWTEKPYSEDEQNILNRFKTIIDLTFRRYLDLKKAEAQARESQIQLALERVRARTMAMQKSDELAETAQLLFRIVESLGVALWTCGFFIWDDDRKATTAWMGSGQGTLSSFKIPSNEHIFLRFYEAAQRGEPLHVLELKGEAMETHYRYMHKIPVAGDRLKNIVASGDTLPATQILHAIYFLQGYLLFITLEPARESWDIFKRFAKVFEQTYTRFLDLQKAEAQAREAQIEASLERVRSKTMAMHNSNDVGETVATMFAEFVHLGIHTNRCGILIFNDPNVAEVWTARSTPGGSAKLIIGKLDLDAHKLLRYGYNAWKAKETFYQYDLIDDDLKNYYNAINNSKFYPTLFDLNALPVKEFCSDFFFTDGMVFSFTNEPVAEEYAKIIKRFALVFGQTYRRYLDLQKAEVQAREAQIETSLERVRSKTMAMHSSDDVTSATATMFTELDRLGIENMRCGIAHYQEDHKMEVWSVSNLADGKVVKGAGLLDTNSLPFWKIFYSTWQKKEDFLYYLMAGKEKEDYFKKISTLENYLSRSIEDVPDLSIQTYYFPEGSVWAFSLKPHSEEDKQVMKRFASVFSLTFRRYQDLQKAEAQVREARIEAALERVRARTMAMQRSDELREAATLLFQQVQLLEIPVWTCGYNIWETGEESCTGWMSTRGAIQPSFSIPLTESPVFIRMNESRLRGEPFFTEEVSGEALADHYRYMFSLPDFKKIATEQLKDGFTLPSSQVHNIFNFKHGNVIFISAKPVPESWDIFKRFTAVFEQTYIRFNDLKQAEERAREAVKHASVDRVRAEIASMRTTNDLEKIIPLIWNELTTLGVPFIRCGVFIMDEEQQQVHTFLSTPEGEAIAAFHLPYSAPGETAAILAHWHKKEMYKQHWNEDQFIEFTKNLVQQGAITTGEKYLTENRPTDLYLHFLPFLQGMLYAGNTAPLSDDALQLMQELADAFSTAYARYEDFNKLELAKEQIEKTLVDLKQAQAQLVQSEKMASLGELTAGIAHEIQNPLNFVNNFSEVNTELIEELKGERSKVKGERDEKLEDQLLSDLLENEQKIIHHGKRADAIVKNMLQHSRTSKGVKELTDINALCDEYLRLSFHGLRAKDKSFNTDFKTDFDNSIGRINIIPQDLGRVLLNLVNNAFYAVNEKLKAHGSQLTADYKPLVSVQTKKIEDKVEIIVSDNGNGIPQNIVDKIFQPFFTTKPTGQGTGLGLSLSYDIIKAHGGEIKVETKEGEGSEFVIWLPIV